MAEMRGDTPIDISEDRSKGLLNDVERGLYDFIDEEREEDFYKVDEGLTEEIVRQISQEKMHLGTMTENLSPRFLP